MSTRVAVKHVLQLGLFHLSGSFGSSGEDEAEALIAMFGEVLEAFDGTEAQAPDERENGIARGREGLGCRCPYRKLDSSIAVVQAADHRLGNDATKPLHRSADRRVLA